MQRANGFGVNVYGRIFRTPIYEKGYTLRYVSVSSERRNRGVPPATSHEDARVDPAITRCPHGCEKLRNDVAVMGELFVLRHDLMQYALWVVYVL